MNNNTFRYILLILITFSLSLLSAKEIRSLWALPWNLANPTAIDQLVADAVFSRQTEILAEVRYRADALYIPNRLSSQYPNPEPRSSIINSVTFDPLSYLLEKAHEQGIEVQAWVTVFCATTTQADKLNNNFLYRYHDDWIMTDATGRRMGLANQMGYFVDPGIPEVQEHLYNVFMDIATGYPDLDGIHLDYIRYPTKNYGYHPVSVKRFNEFQVENDIAWNDWRIAQVTGFVKRLNEGIKSNDPHMMLTAAVISYIGEARIHYAQDWVKWLQDGIVDRVYPMAYASGNKLFNPTINEIASKTNKEKVVVGLRAWQEPGVPYYGVEKIIEKAEYCRKLGMGGLALFSYEGVKKANMLTALTNALYYWSEPVKEESLDDKFITELVQTAPESFARKDTTAFVEGDIPTPVKSRTIELVNEPVASVGAVRTPAYCENITFDANKYFLSFFFENERRWKWLILDINDTVVFEKFRTYPGGHIMETWDGYTNNGEVIPPGVYILNIVDDFEKQVYQKRFIVY